MVPILTILIAAAVLMVMHYRQERANERNETEALQRTAALARSYAQDVAAAPHGFPGQDSVRDIAERHDGRLVSYARSEDSLTTTVRFFGEYEDTSMFGVSHSQAYRCYSVVFQKDAAGVPQARTTPLEKCDVI
jgi:type II secretory pathway pseudopilin PulG